MPRRALASPPAVRSTRWPTARVRAIDPRFALLLSAATTAAWLVVWPALDGIPRLLLVVAAALAYAVALNALTRSPNRGLNTPIARTAIVTAALLLATASFLAPRGSQDVWSYVMYGRTVAVHDASPYTHAPAVFSDDPYLDRVSRGWRDSPSVYGPAFTAYSAGSAAIAGGSALAARLGHQLLAAVSVMVVGASVARRRRDISALVFVAFNPAVVAIVNGGHNDLLVGALVAAAIALAGRRRPAAAGLVMSVAVLVKIIAVLPAIVLLAWLWHRFGRKVAAIGTVAAAAPVVAGYALAGGLEALKPVLAGAHYTSRASLWSAARGLASFPWPLGRWSPQTATVGTAIVMIAALGIVAAINRRRWLAAPSPASGATGALVTLLYALPYVLPWYSGWLLPTATLVHASRLARFARWQSTALVVAYADPPGALSGGTITSVVSRMALPATAAATVFTAWCQRHRAREET